MPTFHVSLLSLLLLNQRVSPTRRRHLTLHSTVVFDEFSCHSHNLRVPSTVICIFDWHRLKRLRDSLCGVATSTCAGSRRKRWMRLLLRLIRVIRSEWHRSLLARRRHPNPICLLLLRLFLSTLFLTIAFFHLPPPSSHFPAYPSLTAFLHPPSTRPDASGTLRLAAVSAAQRRTTCSLRV